MEHFVTLFDSTYLPHGIELHKSMERHVPDFVLWIICVDREAFEVLSKLNLSHTRLLELTGLETQELLSVKPGRSTGEYCWTLTPFAPRFVFEADQAVERVTYLDADIWFLRDPFPIFDEFDKSGKSVLITGHSYAPEYDQSATSGQFCVQFMTFKRSESEIVRKWWEDRCIEWCYARYEDGKFGDQMYLDDWPKKFSNAVHVLRDRELLLAPWNVTRFPMGRAVAFHFHGVRVGRQKILLEGSYRIPKRVVELIFDPYLESLGVTIQTLRGAGFLHVAQEVPKYWRRLFLVRLREIRGLLWPNAVGHRLK